MYYALKMEAKVIHFDGRAEKVQYFALKVYKIAKQHGAPDDSVG